ncbi:uncharacterized protein LOC133652763 [Entelurus aequoreus]|uniref:uncharacterized protein LOC133652763 n=1 Tax=Entelurus aequoreus TaxID=161455 RepID=UPI002B1E6D3D|nr:uncharacterized protein LOC133652763 [Entelurus aequoreus]
MLGTNKMTLWVMTGFCSVTTVVFNVFLFLMSLHDYQRRKKHQSIMAALSVANISHQLLCYLWMSMDDMDAKCHVGHTPYAVLLVLIFSLKFSIMWDSSLLTLYYSTKLVSAPGRRHAAINRLVVPAVLMVPLWGVATCMPMLAVFHPANHTAGNRDCGVLMPDTEPGQIYEAVYLILSDVLPGILMVQCCVSISAHLARHLGHMKASSNGAHLPKTGAQMRVIRMSLSLVVVFLLFLVVDLYVNYQIAVHHQNAITLTFFFTSVYTAAAAMVLIYGKKSMWKVLASECHVCVDACSCLEALEGPEQEVQGSRPPAGIKN